jgi:tetratricopeptide (TPR) repeat protein
VDTQKTLLVPIVVYMAGAVALLSAPATAEQHTQSAEAALAVTLTPDEASSLTSKGTTSVAAYDAFLRGMRYLNVRDEIDVGGYYRAREQVEAAIRLDPNYANAIAGLGLTNWYHAATVDTMGSYRTSAFELAEQSLALADNALGHRILARKYVNLESRLGGRLAAIKDFDQAVAEMRKAVAIEPNNADGLAELAYFLAFAGEPDESVDLIDRARRLNPNFPAWYHRPAGIAHFVKCDYGAAIEEIVAWYESEALPYRSALMLVSAHALAGDVPRASEALSDLLRTRPKLMHYTVNSYSVQFPFKHQEHLALFEEGLRRAGVANTPE